MIYAKVLEESALEQYKDAMKQDFVVQGALMPDAHQGYSLPIGAVIATKGVIVPSWVGYDIGCGMCALKLEGVPVSMVRAFSKEIFDAIYESIPVGFNTNTIALEYSLDGLTEAGKKIAKQKNYDKALGSLGGGNHFIEIGVDTQSYVWVIIHSGSRGVGHGIASHYMSLASSDPAKIGEEFDKKITSWKDLNSEGYSEARANYIVRNLSKVKPKEGHYGLDVESQLGKEYIQDMNWCLDYALANRKEMMSRILYILGENLGDWDNLINKNHNHAVERDGLWIHRKGATQAEEGMMGVIPGNMRDGSFIVRGKGNPDSLYSSSHGAGRVLGRREAMRTLKLEDFEKDLEFVQALVTKDTLDESPLAYKDIFEVMKAQEDLVEVVTHVLPIINIKG